jgi:thiol-disulfide isomerase/thioredoxin
MNTTPFSPQIPESLSSSISGLLGRLPRHIYLSLLSPTAGPLCYSLFFAFRCGPCQQIKPFYKALSEEFQNVLFAYCDVEENEVRIIKYFSIIFALYIFNAIFFFM